MLKKTLLIFLITFSIYVNAQTTTQQRTQPALDENTIVRGEDGMVYPYKLWKAYLQTGKYSLKSRNTTGKVVVLNFWFINCPPCKSEYPI